MQLPKRIIPKFVPTNSYLHKMVWPQRLQNVYLARKTSDPNVISKTHELVTKLHQKYPINICTDHRTFSKLGLPFITPIASPKDLAQHVDLILSLGGDGTVLRSGSMFQAPSEPPPPQLPISLGTLGFLLPFQYEKALSVFDDVYNNNANATRRSRLRMSYKKEMPLFALNDITIHRGQSPHLAHLDVYVNNQLLTHSIGDGVIISTPTGSTAYSLSSGGSIVHPQVESILVTPVCPRSLSFRPVLFPVNSQIVIKLSAKARGPVSIHLDGSITRTMYKGDEIHICSYENEGVWFVSQKDDWVPRVNTLLGFNSQFGIPKNSM